MARPVGTFENLTNPSTAPGGCASIHSVDRRLAFGYLFASHPHSKDLFVTLRTLISLGRQKIHPHIGKHVVFPVRPRPFGVHSPEVVLGRRSPTKRLYSVEVQRDLWAGVSAAARFTYIDFRPVESSNGIDNCHGCYPRQRSITGLIRCAEALTQPPGAARVLREPRPDVARNQRDRRTSGDLTEVPEDGPKLCANLWHRIQSGNPYEKHRGDNNPYAIVTGPLRPAPPGQERLTPTRRTES